MTTQGLTGLIKICLPVQANGAGAFKLAMSLISYRLEGIDARILNALHDEITVKARDGIEDQAQAIVKEAMEGGIREYYKKFGSVPVVRAVCTNRASTKEVRIRSISRSHNYLQNRRNSQTQYRL